LLDRTQYFLVKKEHRLENYNRDHSDKLLGCYFKKKTRCW